MVKVYGLKVLENNTELYGSRWAKGAIIDVSLYRDHIDRHCVKLCAGDKPLVKLVEMEAKEVE